MMIDSDLAPPTAFHAANDLTQPASADAQRVRAVDVVRGYTMAVLIVTPFVLELLRALPNGVVVQELHRQLTHSKWHGVTYYDVGFSAFVLVVGMSISLSLGKVVDDGRGSSRLYWRLARRTCVLLLLGFLVSGGFKRTWPDVRLAGPLQRVAVCYFIASLVVLNFRPTGRIVAFLVLLLGYWAILTLVPVPGSRAGDLSFEGNIAAYVDRQWLPGRSQFQRIGWDPEGILTTLGAIGTCVLGVVIGSMFRDPHRTPQQLAKRLAMIGIALLLVGYLWSYWLPLNKTLWTPSFVVHSAGNCTLTLAVIYQITDVWKKSWLLPFTVIGQNTLIAYFAVGILPFEDLARRIVGGDVQRLLGDAGPVLLGLVQLGMCWALLHWLYRKGLTMKL